MRDGHPQDAHAEVFLVDHYVADFKQSPSLIENYHGWPLERLGALNINIPPGGLAILPIGIVHDAYHGTELIADYVFTTLDLYFSDGTTRPYTVAAAIPPIGAR